MIRKHFELDGVCGAARDGGDAWEAVRQSGKALVYLRFVPETDEHAFGITVDGKQVNVCAIGLPAYLRGTSQTTPEVFDGAARGAIRFTAYELECDAEQPGMLSGMDREDFENVLEHDEDYEVVVRRVADRPRKHRW